MDEEKDLSSNESEVNDNSNIDNPADAQNETGENSNEKENSDNGSSGLASSNRAAFARRAGNKDYYKDRLNRDQRAVDEAQKRKENPNKTVSGKDGDSEKEKNKLDKAKDSLNLAQSKANLMAGKIDDTRSKIFQAMHPVEATKMVAKAKIKAFLLANAVPILIAFLCIFVLIVVVLMAGGVFGNGSGSGFGMMYESECNYEETKVIVMDGSNTNVLATVSLEDYIIGVACVEIGACGGASSSISEHYVKAQYIASKTYVLSSRGYDSSTKSITVRASTRNQQWCDLKSGCILTKEGGSIYHNSYPGDYDRSKVIGKVYMTRSFTEEDLEVFHQYYKDIYGELYLDSGYNKKVSSLGSSDAVYYKASTQNFWKTEAAKGVTYDQILKNTASSGASDSSYYAGRAIYRLGSYCPSSMVGSGNLVELSEYPNTNDIGKTNIVNKPIESILSPAQIESLNSYIISSVDQAGYGTGAAVATAGQSLIYGLYQYGYHLPYFYGGGHSKGIKVGVDSNWGMHSKFDGSWYSYNAGKNRYIYSYDCSAFVSWAIKNACKSSFSPDSSSGFNGYGPGISLSQAKPGDLMVKPGSHVRLIVKNTGNGVIAAESTSGFIKNGGILFVEYKSAGGYKIVDMSNWYSKKCNSSR